MNITEEIARQWKAQASSIVSEAVKKAIAREELKSAIAARVAARRPTPRQEHDAFITRAAQMADATGISIADAVEVLKGAEADAMSGSTLPDLSKPVNPASDATIRDAARGFGNDPVHASKERAVGAAIGLLSEKELGVVMAHASDVIKKSGRGMIDVLHEILVKGAK